MLKIRIDYTIILETHEHKFLNLLEVNNICDKVNFSYILIWNGSYVAFYA